MRFLNEECSWNLLQNKVFEQQSSPVELERLGRMIAKSCGEQQSSPAELERIGRMIAKSCGGLPLAIDVAAGILAKVDRTQYHWRKIAKNISLSVATNDDQFSKILTLSYDHLPCHLKACFLCMGGFPEDYNIPVSKLTKLWVAEGFLKPNGPKSLEELAEECLEDLVKRNLVLNIRRRSNGKIKFCGLHDLLRDLCIRKAEEEEFLHVINLSVRSIPNQRRLSIHSDLSREFEEKHLDHVIKTSLSGATRRRSKISRFLDAISGFAVKDASASTIHSTSTIRSILLFVRYSMSLSFIVSYRLLRILDFSEAILDFIPRELTLLVHLRFLAFTYWDSEQKLMLHPSISKLQNLQTLIIRLYASEALVLPFQVWKLPQLRHLIFSKRTILPIPLAVRIGLQVPVLENLQTLCGVKNFRFTSKAIEMIPNLKKLKVSYIGLSRENWQEYCLQNLIRLHQLETLNFTFEPISWCWQDTFPVIFALPRILKKLTLSGCNIPWRHMVIIGMLPNLEVLKLRNSAFTGREWECTEGEFPRLKYLLMEGLNLERWLVESSHFPCLVHLIIKACWKLEEIRCQIGDIPTLQLIEVGPGSKFAADSVVLIHDERRSLGNDLLHIRIHS
ncbi:UNVERIFIED_CONTAM: putative late blight resistance proteinR1A-10 [Sesamum latifolium]|uniref:Late blight resistance proteinR1A-10 n=1 Tax=Sesamum latifolium TaxID=2727402 RepID=A0AAW2YE91_9LAMI